jgi:hypothetical protein
LAQEQISHLDKPTGETQGSPLLSWARAEMQSASVELRDEAIRLFGERINSRSVGRTGTEGVPGDSFGSF